MAIDYYLNNNSAKISTEIDEMETKLSRTNCVMPVFQNQLSKLTGLERLQRVVLGNYTDCLA